MGGSSSFVSPYTVSPHGAEWSASTRVSQRTPPVRPNTNRPLHCWSTHRHGQSGRDRAARHGDAVRYGLRLAADLGTPEQDEARRLVDETLDTDVSKAAMRVLLAIWHPARG